MFIVDAHLDLAYNALRYGRDLRQDLATLRQREAKLKTQPNGEISVTLGELRRGAPGEGPGRA
jgi:membrane dipeptidase